MGLSHFITREKPNNKGNFKKSKSKPFHRVGEVVSSASKEHRLSCLVTGSTCLASSEKGSKAVKGGQRIMCS